VVAAGAGGCGRGRQGAGTVGGDGARGRGGGAVVMRAAGAVARRRAMARGGAAGRAGAGRGEWRRSVADGARWFESEAGRSNDGDGGVKWVRRRLFLPM
jgi:hypothetical protein